ncbi:MAG: arsenate reductase ArsC [Fimbriimonadaceae bacterium]|nr:MAG: arsenate reductase ArsC [Fimbriimonadaceae bacterium]
MNILFVCVENSNRSQMAEAFAKHYGNEDSYSAGSRPSGKINPKAIAAMAELGIDISNNNSNGLDDLPKITWDWAITMGCGDACPHLPALNRDDWALADPRDMEPADFNKVRDEIARRVRELLKVDE